MFRFKSRIILAAICMMYLAVDARAEKEPFFADGSLGHFNVSFVPVSGKPHVLAVRIEPINVAANGDIISVHLINRKELVYKELLENIVVNKGEGFLAGYVEAADGKAGYDTISLTSAPADATVPFLARTPLKQALGEIEIPLDRIPKKKADAKTQAPSLEDRLKQVDGVYGYGASCEGPLGTFKVYVLPLDSKDLKGDYEIWLNPSELKFKEAIDVAVANKDLTYKIVGTHSFEEKKPVLAGHLSRAELERFDLLNLVAKQKGLNLLQVPADKGNVCELPEVRDRRNRDNGNGNANDSGAATHKRK